MTYDVMTGIAKDADGNKIAEFFGVDEAEAAYPGIELVVYGKRF